MGIPGFITGIFLLIISGCQLAKAWSYEGDDGPDHWPGVCKTGKNQSPINIVTDDVIRADLGSLKFIRYDFAFGSTVTNTGHSVQIQLSGVPIHLKGGGLPSTFVLEQMHFHWPAEHTIDGKRPALELHFVHYDKQYSNVSTAALHENGVAVVAALFEISDHDNHDLVPILNGIVAVTPWVGPSTAEIQTKILPLLFLPKDHTTYYRYRGSLTTPQCHESVMWYVLTEKLTVSEFQLKIFSNVRTSHGRLIQNYRPVKELGLRKVHHHLDGYSSAYVFSSSWLLTICCIVVAKISSS